MRDIRAVAFLMIAAACPAAAQPRGGAAEPLPSGATEALTLEQAVEEGVRNNLDLMAARYVVPLARADELAAAAWYNPVVSIDTVFQPFHGTWDQRTAGGPRQYDLGVAYPLDLNRKIHKRTESAQRATRAAEAALQDAVRQKALEIRLSYIDAALAAESVLLSREREIHLQRLVDIVEARIHGPSLLPLVQTRATLALQRAKLSTRQRETELRSAKALVSLAVGRANASVVLGTKLRSFDFAPLPDVEEAIRLAYESRPDMAALRFLQQKGEADLELARAMIWDNPTLGLALSSQRGPAPNPQDPSSAGVPAANSWGASLALPLPIFDRNHGMIRRSELVVEQAGRLLRALELSVRREIEGLYEQLELRREQIRLYEAGELKNAQTVRDAQQKLFGTGGHALLDYFDGLQAYNDTLAEYLEAVADHRRAAARLNAAVGKDVLP